MNKKDLKKLSRVDLLEILLDQNKIIDSLKAELDETKTKLSQKEIKINQAGSIADAAMELNNIFAIAQETADQYVNNIKKSYHKEVGFAIKPNCKIRNDASLLDYDLKDEDILNWEWDV